MMKSKDWQKHLRTLMGYYNFECIKSVDLCQMFLLVFIQKELLIFIDKVNCDSKSMGFANIIGNKGGMYISFRLLGYLFIILNCHLAPKVYKILERDNMVKKMVQQFKIENEEVHLDVLGDYVIWKGDMNYRIDFTFNETIEFLREEKHKLLLDKDQLRRQIKFNKVFYNFKEQEINFNPTYRRERVKEKSKDQIEKQPSFEQPKLNYSNKQGQAPSWCDRILISTSREIDYSSYMALQDIRHSDHLPVECQYKLYITLPTVDYYDITKHDNIHGKYKYSKIIVEYNLNELFSEIDIEINLPLDLKLKFQHSLIEKVISTLPKVIPDDNPEQMIQINFDNIDINIPPYFVFDLPQCKALNTFIFLIAIINKKEVPIAFGKYCIEDIERNKMNILNFSKIIDLFYKTRKLGTVSFNIKYEMEKIKC